MALRLNKTSKIVVALGVVLLSGALGFLIWRVNQGETTAPEESEAGENSCNCCPNGYLTMNPSLVPAYHSGCIPCSCTYTAKVCQKISDGTWVRQCTISECTEGSDCNLHCVWNQVNYCDRTAGGVCKCKAPPNNCGTNTPCTISCPSGYSKCTSGTGCNTIEKKCTCPGCDNIYYVQEKCKKNTTISCGDGIKNGTEECDPKATPTGCKTGEKCLADCTCSATVQETCGDGKLTTGEQCELGNPSGNSCLWSSPECDQVSCICSIKSNLIIKKSAVEECIDEGTENPKSELTYVITITNRGTTTQQVTKVRDVLDSKILENGIEPTGITSPGAYSAGKILWSYATTPLSIGAGRSKSFTYKVIIDKDSFGTYSNVATMTKSDGTTMQASANITADCIIEDTEIPETGIFDSTLGRIGAGVVLLILGGIVYNIPNGVLIVKKKENSFKYRSKFEKKY